jgi:hypothetical protein
MMYTIKGLITSKEAHNIAFFREIGSDNINNDWFITNDKLSESRGTWEDIIRSNEESLNYPKLVIY